MVATRKRPKRKQSSAFTYETLVKMLERMGACWTPDRSRLRTIYDSVSEEKLDFLIAGLSEDKRFRSGCQCSQCRAWRGDYRSIPEAFPFSKLIEMCREYCRKHRIK